MAKKKIIPLGNRVLVEPISQEEKKSASGIILPDTLDKEKPEQGKVIEVGPGKGKTPMNVKKGDLVVFSKYGYDEVLIDEKEYYIIEEDKILAVIK